MDAIDALASDPAWRNSAVIAALADEVAGAPELSRFYQDLPVNSVPAAFRKALPVGLESA